VTVIPNPDRMRPSPRTLLQLAVLCATLIAGLSLFWPSLNQGVFADDYVAIAMMDGTFAAPRGSLDLFNFASGNPADVTAVKRLGSVPWWAPRDFRVSFMRPLSSALWHVDRALFGTWYAGYHLHSLLAWALLAVSAALLYRTLLPAGIALIALPIFALDHSLHFPTVWLSNRGGLYATALGALALVCHVRGREREPRYLGLSALLWAVALAFGEWAFPMLAYVLAYELFDHGSALGDDPRRDSIRMRLLGLAPAATLGLVFVVLRAKLGYGATGSGAYVDPADETGLFIGALIGRVPVFVGDMMFNVSSAWWDHGSPWRQTFLDLELISPELWGRMPYWRFFHTLIGFGACALVAVLYGILVRKRPALERKRLTFLLVGGLMSLVPVVGSFPSTRLTMAAFIGVAPLIAAALAALLARAYRMCTRSAVHAAFAYVAACGIVALHGIAPLTERIGLMIDNHRTTAQWVGRAPLDPERVRDQRVYLLASTEFTTTFFFAYIWAAQDKPVPKSVQPLVAAPYAFDVERTGPSTLIIQTLGGGLLTSSQEHMFRSRLVPARVGDRFALDGVRVTVLREYRGEAQSIALDFDLPLDDPSQVLLVAKREGFERWIPPAIGELARVPRAQGPSWYGLERARSIAAIGVPPEAMAYTPTPTAIRFDPDK
jgi:hypothetical protein